MKAWLMSPGGTMTVTILIAAGACLAMLRAVTTQGISIRTIAASLLIQCFILFLFGGMLFTGRVFLKWQIEERSFLVWERGFIIAAVLITVLGLVLLEDMLHTAGDSVLARIGLISYLFGAVIVVVAETNTLSGRNAVDSQIVIYVILAFLTQAVFGVALLRTGLVAGWAGWATVIWNVGWLLVMVLVRPADIYYPVLHHVAPLIIGIALLMK
jgi:hypothetical protein